MFFSLPFLFYIQNSHNAYNQIPSKSLVLKISGLFLIIGHLGVRLFEI
jgi:hypothetical protein